MFQKVPDILGKNQANNCPLKTICARRNCHRREPRAASNQGSDIFRDCTPGWRQITSRDTSPNHQHGFISQHVQNYNPTLTSFILAPCHNYSTLCDNRPRINCVYPKVLHTKLIARCMTRQNTSSQNTTVSKPFRKNSGTICDKNATDRKTDERQVVYPVFPNLSTLSFFTSGLQLSYTRPVQLQLVRYAVPKFRSQNLTRYRIQSNKIICTCA